MGRHDGPKAALPFTSIAAAVAVWPNIHVFYQDPAGGILKAEYAGSRPGWDDGQSTGALFFAAKWSPLAVVHWKDGQEVILRLRLSRTNEKLISS